MRSGLPASWIGCRKLIGTAGIAIPSFTRRQFDVVAVAASVPLFSVSQFR
jgi:hypothetical protein